MLNKIPKNAKTITYEVFNAITHGVSFIVAIFLSVMLIDKAVNEGLRPISIASIVVYCAAVLVLYLASTLFHCFVFTRAGRVFQILDHTNIFILIAGTYTPYCIVFIHNKAGYLLLGAVWLLSIIGILFHIFAHGKHQKIETTIYVVMGWLCLLLGKDLYISLSPSGFFLLVAGGVIFTLGALIYSIPKLSGAHLIWHFFVMAGTLAMFLSIYMNI
ncbi:hemolysin III family protein [Lentilactobacillus sp. Marseille-Q4993]|uniref:PAQR family membrane homeostasis protein TrhA n=1 Tax=Lentilactobacillus sp. Marseille-Q4993 TaxID=3039492 RepID=UPI0024BC22F4|nr:hemolysin III family protein [Lentilactobacillus sp. Marseille-Q4993]